MEANTRLTGAAMTVVSGPFGPLYGLSFLHIDQTPIPTTTRPISKHPPSHFRIELLQKMKTMCKGSMKEILS
jgi:hypothetical protein